MESTQGRKRKKKGKREAEKVCGVGAENTPLLTGQSIDKCKELKRISAPNGEEEGTLLWVHINSSRRPELVRSKMKFFLRSSFFCCCPCAIDCARSSVTPQKATERAYVAALHRVNARWPLSLFSSIVSAGSPLQQSVSLHYSPLCGLFTFNTFDCAPTTSCIACSLAGQEWSTSPQQPSAQCNDLALETTTLRAVLASRRHHGVMANE